MSIKTKITSLITTFVLLCSLLTVGVFAVKNTTFNVGGDIVFNVQGIEAEVKLEELTNASLKDQTYNTGADTDKLKTFELDNDMTASQVQACYNSWSGLDMKFDTEADVLLKIRITNKTEIADNILKVDMSATFGASNNATISVDKATATINPGDYEIFTITFSITNKEYSANIDNFAVNVNMSKVEQTESLLKYDSENNYYYLEMGTYNESPVRWRYVSDVTNGIDTAVRFDLTTSTPVTTTGKKGMFILETQTFNQSEIDETMLGGDYEKDGIVKYLSSDKILKNSQEYDNSNFEYDIEDEDVFTHANKKHENVLANDYALSDVRAFLNGRNDVNNNSVGSFLDLIKIDEKDVVYQKIQTRTLQDLYLKMNVSDGLPVDAVIDPSIDTSVSDKFWLLSIYEAHKLLGGKVIDDENKMTNKDVDDLAWINDGLLGFAFYWLRGTVSSNDDYVGYGVSIIGDMLNGIGGGISGLVYIDFPFIAARPAFILEF